jgi:hypothetical protein
MAPSLPCLASNLWLTLDGAGFGGRFGCDPDFGQALSLIETRGLQSRGTSISRFVTACRQKTRQSSRGLLRPHWTWSGGQEGIFGARRESQKQRDQHANREGSSALGEQMWFSGVRQKMLVVVAAGKG